MAHILMVIEEHEMREFLRIAPTYWAPFHPHHTDGIRRWIGSANVASEWQMVIPDMHFGIA